MAFVLYRHEPLLLNLTFSCMCIEVLNLEAVALKNKPKRP